MLKSSAILAACLLLLPNPGEVSGGRSLYPPERSETNLFFFVLEGDVQYAPLREALKKLGEGAEIVYGPKFTSAVPNDHFVVVEAPAGVTTKAVAKALKKGKAKPFELHWMMARWSITELPEIPASVDRAQGTDMLRGLVVGMHGDMRWFELRAPYTLYFFEPGKIDPEWVFDRLRKMVEPYVPEEFSIELVRDTFTWPLAQLPSESKIKKAQKAIGKLDGVASVSIDAEAGTLEVALDLGDLLRSGPAGAYDAASASGEPAGGGAGRPNQEPISTGFELRPIFDTGPIFEILEKNQVVPAPPTEEEPAAGEAGQ